MTDLIIIQKNRKGYVDIRDMIKLIDKRHDHLFRDFVTRLTYVLMAEIFGNI